MGSSATGVFSNLDIRGRIILSGPVTTTGRLTLGAGARLSLNGQSLIVGGQLASNVTTGAVPVIAGPASTFIVSGLAVNGLVIQAAPLTVNGGTLTQFDNVSFAGFAPEAIQLTINHPGLPASFTLLGISFSTNPTTGRLILANDTRGGCATRWSSTSWARCRRTAPPIRRRSAARSSTGCSTLAKPTCR